VIYEIKTEVTQSTIEATMMSQAVCLQCDKDYGYVATILDRAKIWIAIDHCFENSHIKLRWVQEGQTLFTKYGLFTKSKVTK
jgi:hypothetical protein